MKKSVSKAKKSAQDIQYEVFREMSADRKLKIASTLTQLVIELCGGRIDYNKPRPEGYFERIYCQSDKTIFDLKIVIPRQNMKSDIQ